MNVDPHMWKDTYTYEMRPTYVRRDLHMGIIFIMQMWKETYTYEWTIIYVKIDLHTFENRTTSMKRDVRIICNIYVWKETCTYE